MPIYNAEKYLERCVKSLIAQTFHDIEILLIDDGSTDASSILCARLKKEDSRIRILHKPNGGLSSARNAGLLAASGAFIGFVDADDTVSPTFFETLLQKIEQYHCDFVFCDLIRIESGKPPTLRSASLHGGYYDKRKIKRCVFPQLIMRDDLEYGPLLSVCVCLYRTSFLKEHDLRFDETVRYSEDYDFYRSEMHGLSPVGSPTYVPPESTFDKSSGESFVCSVCGYVYSDPNFSFEELPDNWVCPVCKMPKKAFVRRN